MSFCLVITPIRLHLLCVIDIFIFMFTEWASKATDKGRLWFKSSNKMDKYGICLYLGGNSIQDALLQVVLKKMNISYSKSQFPPTYYVYIMTVTLSEASDIRKSLL